MGGEKKCAIYISLLCSWAVQDTRTGLVVAGPISPLLGEHSFFGYKWTPLKNGLIDLTTGFVGRGAMREGEREGGQRKPNGCVFTSWVIECLKRCETHSY